MTFQIHVGDQVYLVTADSQAEAVLVFEQDHPGLGGSIMRVEPLDREPVNGPDGHASDAA